jgi:23S rRNA (cytidine1920-2'-O)/16S rRNA (cytidine1409-2'-O)-methyltransferase
MRLDLFLHINKYTKSRNKAKEVICSGDVYVNDIAIKKPSYIVAENDSIEIKAKTIYVSRSALKLKNFLQNRDELVNNKQCLDIGSSKGGFVQVLLEFNALNVDGIDVGTAQFDTELMKNDKIKIYQNMDIRDYNPNKKYDLITCDLSFISMEHVIGSIVKLANDNIIILFKPQFEVGKSVKRDKAGVVVDKNAIKFSIDNFIQTAISYDLIFINKTISEIKGKNGNEEFFLQFKIK